MITRLGLIAIPRSLYGSFAGKTEEVISVSPIQFSSTVEIMQTDSNVVEIATVDSSTVEILTQDSSTVVI